MNRFFRVLRGVFRRSYASAPPRASKAPFALFALGGAVGGFFLSKLAEPKKKLASTTKLEEVPKFEYASDLDLKKGFQEIEELLDGDVTRSPAELDYHSDSYFNTHKANPGERPKLVVYPSSTEQVSQIMKICYKYKIPVVPFSGGTSLEGHYILTRPGIVFDFSKMTNIISFNEADLDISVQAGVGWQELDEYLAPHGLLFGPDPGPGARIGGMVATSCSGTQAFRYGTMKENVLNLTVVLADGTILKTKQRLKKSAAGYNLTGLFIGSEGTLGVITEATLKLAPRPENESVIVATFDTVKDATDTVEHLLRKGTALNAIELLDSAMIHCVNSQTTKKRKETPTLLFKVGGANKSILKENIKIVKSISKEHGYTGFEFADDEEEKLELWQARKLALFSSMDYGKLLLGLDAKVWVTDVAVPISKLSSIIADTRENFSKYDPKKDGIFSTFLGHVGDGNFHAVVMYRPEKADIVKELTSKMVYGAIDLEGTCTGEHGVGMGKRDFLVKEVGENSINLMRQLKLALDPYGLLNTDKVFKMDPNDSHGH